jgi:hypothetical protein
VGEAVVLPITEEVGGEALRIRLAPRLTPHVRHLSKYIDIPVSPRRVFVFTATGTGAGRQARTLREFVAVIEDASPELLDGYLRSNDFSRWVAEVFGDYPLARDIRRLEDEWRTGAIPDIAARIGQAVRARYEFLEAVP